VNLVLPARPAVARLAEGSVIRQSQSADALELQAVFDNLLPMLAALQPDKLSLTLTALGQGLNGRGAELGRALVTFDAYLKRLNPALPGLEADIKLLAGFARTYTRASPDILRALADFSVAGQTIARQRASFDALLVNLTTASDDLQNFLAANAQNLIRLSADSQPTLRILARYAPEFPCTLASLAAFVPVADRVLGAGTGQPGLHVRVVVVPSPGRYLPGRDTPVYGDNLGPHCYRAPFRGIRLHDAANELTALLLGRPPSQVASWASLLTGPLLRGTDVIVSARPA
jgi:phospholipid/cholesterol/gamma-HCH transport system substrate-binding protein